MSVSTLLVVLLVLWQVAYLAAVFRRRVWIGVGLVVYSAIWYGLFAWADIAWTTTITVLTVPAAASVVMISSYAPTARRAVALAFVALGMALVVGRWVGPGAQHWRVVAALFVALGLLIFGLGYALSGFGKFGVVSLRGRRTYDVWIGSQNYALYKYRYWSKRAINSIMSDNRAKGRFSMKLKEIGINLVGISSKFENAVKESGRHAGAQELERQLERYIHTDARKVLKAGGGFMVGYGTVYMTAYGTESVDESPTGGRAALFTYWTTSDHRRVAVCLFGSVDNFDGRISGTQPVAVSGWANSATPDVMRWLQEGEDWNIKQWRESVGNVACKMASYDVAIGRPTKTSSTGNNERRLMGSQQHAEWLGLIYHVEERNDEYMEVPFDIVLIGRPIWLRGHISVKTTDEYSVSNIAELRERSYVTFWREKLRLRDGSVGWPVYLYRFLLARQGIDPAEASWSEPRVERPPEL